MKLLFLRFSSIGDIVLTSPAIRIAKEQIPGVEIHFATKKAYRKLVEENPNIDKVHILEEDLSDLILKLKKENFDEVIDLHNNLRTLRIKRALGKPSTSFAKLNIEKWLMVNFKVDRLPDVHIVERYCKTLEHLGASMDKKGLEFYIAQVDQYDTSKLGADFHQGYNVFAIGAQHFTKILPPEKLVEVVLSSKLPVILLGDKNDETRGKELLKDLESQEGPTVVNLCGQLSLGQSADLIRKSKGVFSHDSGLMHIAAAFKKPIISFWGNTVPQFGMYPYQTDHLIIENGELSCRPCTKIGFGKCPKGHFKCMKELNIPENFPAQS